MTIIRIITDISPGENENFVIALIKADGGSFEKQPQPDGKVTIIATFDRHAPASQLPPAGTTEARWMEIARAEIESNVVEVVGDASNPRIETYHATTAGGAQPDHVPWCSSFVNFCIQGAGLAGTRSKMARSWATWGVEADALAPGCIVVLERGAPPSGHVGFYVGSEDGRVRLLGGNQGNRVGIASFEASRVIAKRRPTAPRQDF